MSDYLTQLVTRNLDTAGVVRPRPVPLFAPERTVTRPLVEPEPLPNELTVEKPPLRPAQPPLPATSAADNPMQMQADQPQLLLDHVTAASRHRAGPPPLPMIEPIDVAQPSETVAPHRPAPIMPQPLSLPVASQNEQPMCPNTAPSQPVPTFLTPLPLIERVVVSEPVPSVESPRPPTPVIAQPRLVPAPRDMQPQPPAQAPLTPVQSSLGPNASAIQPMRRPTPPLTAPTVATPEPTIHVTIGRIEVRATSSPPAAAKPSRTPSPVMSLDEYLRARNGERR